MSQTKVKKANATVEYFQDSYLEMKKVTWPTRNQAIRLTLLVLGFCFVAAILIGAMDAIFSFGKQQLTNYATSVNPPAYDDLIDYSAVPLTETVTTEIPLGETTTTTAQ